MCLTILFVCKLLSCTSIHCIFFSFFHKWSELSLAAEMFCTFHSVQSVKIKWTYCVVHSSGNDAQHVWGKKYVWYSKMSYFEALSNGEMDLKLG